MSISINNARKRSFGFGTGTVFMLVILAAVVGWQSLWPHKVKIEREILSQTSNSSTAQPRVSDLLKRREVLKISNKQAVQLRELEAGEKQKLVQLEKEIDNFYRHFNTLVQQTKERPVPIAAIKEAGGTISALSIKKRQIISHYCQAGLSVLTPYQKNLAEETAERMRNKQLKQEATTNK